MEIYFTLILLALTAAANFWSAYEAHEANEKDRSTTQGGPMPVHPKPTRKPLLMMAALTLLTWSAVGYDYYDRHHDIDEGAGAWWTYGSSHYQDIWNQHFENQTVNLDGKFFHNCTFKNVTFDYEGTAPFDFDPRPPFVIGSRDTCTRNNRVKYAFNAVQLAHPDVSFSNAPAPP